MVTKITSTYTSEADFVSKVVEAADAVLSILKIVVLDEAKPVPNSQSVRQCN